MRCERVHSGIDSRAVEEGDRLSGGVAGRAEREALQMSARDAAMDARAVHVRRQELPQRAVVEQRLGRREHEPAGEQREQPVRTRAQHVHGIHVEDLAGAEVRPDALEAGHRAAPAMRFGGEHARGHRAGGGAHDDREGITRARQQLGQREQYARPDRRSARRRRSAPVRRSIVPVVFRELDGRVHRKRIVARLD